MLAGRPLVPVFGDITIEVASILKMSDAAEEVASKVRSLLALLVQKLSDCLLYWYKSTITGANARQGKLVLPLDSRPSASVFVLMCQWTRCLLRQYLYSCTSKACNLTALNAAGQAGAANGLAAARQNQ